MASSLNEWNISPDPETLAYHNRHSDRHSTVEFSKFIAPYMLDSKRVFDLGCGAGGPTEYMAEVFSPTKLFGIDQSEALIALAKQNNKKVDKFYVDDISNLSIQYHRIDGVVSLQTFSWMPDIETPLRQICTKIKPRWMAFSSLFYYGDISTQCIVDEPQRPRKSYYNVYSILRTAAFLNDYGYKLSACKRFDIDVDLPTPANPDLMKTYTVPVKDGPRLQISGPVLLPWYFLAFEKII